MSETAPVIEAGGEEDWTVFAGQYDPSTAPVTPGALEEIEVNLRKLQARLHQSDTIIDRVRQINTLMYLASLCDPRITADKGEDEIAPVTTAESTKAYGDFAHGARLLLGYDSEGLRIHTDTELSHLDSRPIPILRAVEDMKAKGLASPPDADKLGIIARLAAIRELGGNLPPERKPR